MNRGLIFNQNRRNVLKSTVLGTVASFELTQTATAQSTEQETDIRYWPGLQSTSIDDNTILSCMNLTILVDGGLEIGDETQNLFRITNLDTNAEMFVIPEGDQITGIRWVYLSGLFDKYGRIRPEEDQLIGIRTENQGDFIEVPHTIDGDENIFSSEDIFTNFQVDVVDSVTDPTTIATTGARVFATGVERPTIEQNGTTGEIELTLTLPEPPDEAWYIEFETEYLSGDEFDLGRTEIENNGERTLTWTVDASGNEPGTYQDWNFRIYLNEGANTPDSVLWLRGSNENDSVVIEEGSPADPTPAPANFAVEITDPTDGAEVTEEESFDVVADITNTGDERGIQTIELTEPVAQAKADFELEGNSSDSITFTIPKSEVTGDFDITMQTADDTDSVSVTAVDPCFIATAAYDTPTAAEIDILRDFRDDVLRQNVLGRLFIKTYYRSSPPIARWIRRDRTRRELVKQYFVEPLVNIVQTRSIMLKRK